VAKSFDENDNYQVLRQSSSTIKLLQLVVHIIQGLQVYVRTVKKQFGK